MPIRLVKILFIVLLIIFNQNLFGQNCNIKKYIFKKGEKIEYTVYYNWGFVWLKAGKVRFEVSDTIVKNKEIWKFTSIGKTLPGYDWIFTVNDFFQSWVAKDGFIPLYYVRNTQEGNFITQNRYIFSQKTNKIYASLYNSEKGKRKDTLTNEACLFDVLSATYYTRCIDFRSLKKGDEFIVKTIMDGEKTPIKIKYYGTEKVTHKNEKIYTCYHFSTSVVEGNIFKAGQEIHIWVNTQNNNTPVLIKADILVGTVMVYVN